MARLILTLTRLFQFLPAVHETVGALGQVGADFGFEQEGADGAVDST